MACSSTNAEAEPLPSLPDFGPGALVGLLGLDESPSSISYDVLLGRFAEACMRERGFDVSASELVAQSDGASAGSSSFVESQRTLLSEPEFVASFGFGIADSGIASFRAAEPSGLGAVLEGLEVEEREALLFALHGDPQRPGGEDTCMAIAAAQAKVELGQDRWRLYGVYATDIQDRVDSHPEVVRLHRSYATCIASKGFSYTTPIEARLAAEERFIDWAGTAEIVGTLSSDPLAGMSQSSQEAWQRLKDQEVAEASASLRCEATIRSELIVLMDQIEQDWIGENGARVEADLQRLRDE